MLLEEGSVFFGESLLLDFDILLDEGDGLNLLLDHVSSLGQDSNGFVVISNDLFEISVFFSSGGI